MRRVLIRVCSLIVHLHLNRLWRPLVLPYLKAPGGRPGSGPGRLAERLERLSEAGVHVEGGNVVYVGGHHAEVKPLGDLVDLPVELGELCPDYVAVVVDGRYPLKVALVGGLVSVGVEAEAAAAVGKDLLRVAQGGHGGQGSGCPLAGGVEAHLAVHVHVQLGLGFADGVGEGLLLPEQVH